MIIKSGNRIDIANKVVESSLKGKIRFVCAKPVIFLCEQISRWTFFGRFNWVPDDQGFDVVVVDGPGRWLQNGERIILESGPYDISRFPCGWLSGL